MESVLSNGWGCRPLELAAATRIFIAAMEHAGPSTRTRMLLIRAAGTIIILVGAGALLLPEIGAGRGTRLVGALLFVTGAVEILAGLARRHERVPAIAAGAVTAVAGLAFLLNPRGFLSTLNIVIGWLLIRSCILLFAAFRCDSFPRQWTIFAAGVDLLLALLLLAGLQISLLVVGIFGPSGPIIASFAWVLALSFLATGTLLIALAEDAATERRRVSSEAPAAGS